MSHPTLSDIDLKNKMTRVWTTLNIVEMMLLWWPKLIRVGRTFMLEGFSEILRESTSNYYDLQSINIESTVMMNYKNGSMNWFWLFDGLIKQAYPISVASHQRFRHTVVHNSTSRDSWTRTSFIWKRIFTNLSLFWYKNSDFELSASLLLGFL